MGVGYEIEVEKGGAIVRYTGAPTVERLIAAADALSRHPGFHPSMPTVWDLTAAPLANFSADDMLRLAAAVSRLRGRWDRPRVAVVRSCNAGFASARMFTGLNQSRVHANLSVFRSVEEARAWAFEGAGNGQGPEGGAPGGPGSGERES